MSNCGPPIERAQSEDREIHAQAPDPLSGLLRA